MKTRMCALSFILVLVMAWCGISTFGQSLCEFVMPESTISMSDLTFSYRHLYDGRVGAIEASRGWLATRVEKLHDSPDFGYTMWVSTELEMERWLATSWLTRGSMSYRYYFAQDLPLFAYAGVRVDASTRFVQPGCEIRSGVGIGRFRDVTPLAKTYRIIARLLRAGNIEQPLLSRDMLRIAEEIGQSDSYPSFEEYAASVAELVRLVTGAALDSSAVLAIQAELEDEAAERYCGVMLQGGVGYELVDPNREAQDVLYVFSGDVAKALTPDSQVRCRLSWSGASGNFLGENISTLELLYDATLLEKKAVRASYLVQRVAGAQAEAVTLQRATAEYTLGMGRTDLVLGLTMSRQSGDAEWSSDFSISLSLDLL